MRTTEIAMICHTANAVRRLQLGEEPSLPWNLLTDQEKDGIKLGVTIHLSRPDLTLEESHEAWRTNKAADGYVFGPRIDRSKKQHPNMVPFAELDPAQVSKDGLFKGIVNGLKPFWNGED